MSPKTLDSRQAIESCTYHLHSWKPFQLPNPNPKTLDSSDSPKPYSALQTKRQCRADRATSIPIETLDMSKLSLFDDDRPLSANKREKNKNNLRLIAGKRRRRGSRSVSGRSSDRSGTNRPRRCCSVGASAAYGTCSDFPVAVGTDSSGELFVNGDMNWTLDVSEVTRNLKREKESGGVSERENNFNGLLGGQIGNFEGLGNESGYGSEPGYRGDAEFGYGDEFDEEEDDQQRFSLWGDEFGALSKMEKVGENTLQKVHHRCRRRKQDCKMVIA
ncbi:PREDICTED: uncharacterized protein LOC109215259 [Nicotiana attenuata]|uniref:Uncharacterized protein n=1 Tax=Nicotiana attenuata TaxID=49451 RepID=A0A1J6JJ36_NICAT|nr:PREDICTED: uncharacterized protein LOC109215259 [Nicotiana attenuata]OIT06953.1 hypothetical protein A4A49_39415 [Nicotiana attenuata]